MYPDAPLYEQMTYNNIYKKKKKLIEKLQVIKRVAGSALSSFGNLTYIKITIREINLYKQTFVIQMSHGEEVYIPNQLSQRQMSICYQFYDPIFQIIDELCANEKKNLFAQKIDLEMKIAQKEEGFFKNWIQKISKSKNFDADDEDNEVRFKHNSINNNSSLNMVNYLASEHVKSLQQSPYIKIENDIKHVMKHNQYLKKATKNREELGITEDFTSKQMMLRFI